MTLARRLASACPSCRPATWVGPAHRLPLARRLSTYLDVLRAQDPEDRIRFHQSTSTFRPRWEQLIRVGLWAEGFPPVSTHLVPFWTMLHCWEYNTLALDTRTNLLQNVSKQGRMSAGYTIAAVDESHWCSGVILPEDAHALAALILEPHHSLVSKPRLWDGMSRCWPNDERWDAAVQPKFALGVPDCDRLIPRIYPTVDGWPDARAITEATIPCRTLAIPTYRMVHKIDLRNGDTLFSDSFGMRASHWLNLPTPGTSSTLFRIPENGPKISASMTSNNSRRESQILHIWGSPRTLPIFNRKIGGPKLGYCVPHSPETRMRPFAERVIDHFSNTPINWSDPRILAGDATGVKNVHHAMDYVQNFLYGNTSNTNPPSYGDDTLNTTGNSSNKPEHQNWSRKVRPPPRPSSVSRHSRLSPSTESPSSRQQQKPTVKSGMDSARTEANPSTRHLSPSGRKPIPASGPSTPSIVQLSDLKPRVYAQLPDPKGLYDILGLSTQATTLWLDPSMAVNVDKKVASEFRMYAKVYHSDTANYHDRDGNRLHDESKFILLVQARDTLNTLAGRLKYQQENN